LQDSLPDTIIQVPVVIKYGLPGDNAFIYHSANRLQHQSV